MSRDFLVIFGCRWQDLARLVRTRIDSRRCMPEQPRAFCTFLPPRSASPAGPRLCSLPSFLSSCLPRPLLQISLPLDKTRCGCRLLLPLQPAMHGCSHSNSRMKRSSRRSHIMPRQAPLKPIRCQLLAPTLCCGLTSKKTASWQAQQMDGHVRCRCDYHNDTPFIVMPARCAGADRAAERTPWAPLAADRTVLPRRSKSPQIRCRLPAMAAIKVTNLSPFATPRQVEEFFSLIGLTERFTIVDDPAYAVPFALARQSPATHAQQAHARLKDGDHSVPQGRRRGGGAVLDPDGLHRPRHHGCPRARRFQPCLLIACATLTYCSIHHRRQRARGCDAHHACASAGRGRRRRADQPLRVRGQPGGWRDSRGLDAHLCQLRGHYARAPGWRGPRHQSVGGTAPHTSQ